MTAQISDDGFSAGQTALRILWSAARFDFPVYVRAVRERDGPFLQRILTDERCT